MIDYHSLNTGKMVDEYKAEWTSATNAKNLKKDFPEAEKEKDASLMDGMPEEDKGEEMTPEEEKESLLMKYGKEYVEDVLSVTVDWAKGVVCWLEITSQFVVGWGAQQKWKGTQRETHRWRLTTGETARNNARTSFRFQEKRRIPTWYTMLGNQMKGYVSA